MNLEPQANGKGELKKLSFTISNGPLGFAPSTFSGFAIISHMTWVELGHIR